MLNRPRLSGYRRGELSSVFGDGRLLGHGSLSKLGKNAALFDMDDMDRQWEMEFFMGMDRDKEGCGGQGEGEADKDGSGGGRGARATLG